MNWTTGALALAVWGTVAAWPYVQASKTVVVDVVDTAPNFFQPDVLRVKTGDTVVFSLGHDHGTGAAHTVTSVAGPASFDSGVVHWAFKWAPDQAGEYTYICEVHPYMTGIIAVDQAPSVAKAVNGEGGVWPPKSVLRAGAPAIPGEGEVWVDLQWVPKPDRPNEPGVVAVLDTATWKIKNLLPFGNNPHNLTDSIGGRYVYQTSWHGNQVGIFDREAGDWEKVLNVGSAPAHVVVIPDGRAYVSVNAQNFLAVIDPNTHEVVKHVDFAGKGPHGLWADRSGRTLVAALTLSSQAAIVDTTTDQVVAELPVGKLPLAASVNAEGTKAYIPSALDGTITVVDLVRREVAGTIPDVGPGLIQAPFTPDDRWAVQAVSGAGEVAIIDAQSDRVVKRIKTHLGAHGVTFGRKQGGGWYAYVSHKFASVMTIIDMDSLEIAGELEMPGPGGNGIHAMPNVWR